MRKPHYLPTRAGGKIPARCVFADTETQSEIVDPSTEEARLWFGWGVYTRRHRMRRWSEGVWKRYTTPTEFWDWIESLCYAHGSLTVFFHNVSFDATVLRMYTELQARGWELKANIIEEPPTFLKWKRGAHHITIIDTLNFFMMPLERLGQEISDAKLTMPDRDASIEEWDTYCKQDCTVLRTAMLAWFKRLEDWRLGGFKPTLAAQSLAAFQTRFMVDKVFIDDDDEALKMARDAYHGGRTEAFFIGEYPEQVYYVDINSMYPYIMSMTPVPTKLMGVYHYADLWQLDKWVSTYSVVAEVTIETDAPIYAYYNGERLIFPVGTFKLTLTTPEIETALELDHIRAVHKVAVYEQAIIFRHYVEFFYRQRINARGVNDGLTALHCKLFMNSLYGKFGQTGRIFQEIGVAQPSSARAWTEYNLDTHESMRYREIGGKQYLMKREGESRESSPAIAATITAASRMYLWRLISIAGSGNVLYTDTDSLFLTQAGFENLASLLDNEQLGMLKLEAQGVGLYVLGAKHYRFKDKWTIKGIRKSAEKIAPNMYRQLQFRSIRGRLRDEDLERQLIRTIEKRLTLDYRKGVVSDSGWVTPLTLSLSEA